jgi:hypothetical protein
VSEHEARRLASLVSKIMAEGARLTARQGGKPGVARAPALPNFATSGEPARHSSEAAGTPAPQVPAGNYAAADPWWRKFLADQARCQFRDSAGRQCRVARAPGDPTYCIRHASIRGEAPSYPESAAGTGTPIQLEEELMGRLENLRSATAVNFVLGRLLLLRAAGVVGRQDAAVIAYICQLLLQSLPMVKQELESADAPEKMRELLGRVLESTSQLFPKPRESDAAPPDQQTGGGSPSNV